MFPCICAKFVPIEQNHQAIFNSTPSFEIVLILLLFHRNFNHCFTHISNNTVVCSSLCGNTIMLLAHFRPRVSFLRRRYCMSLLKFSNESHPVLSFLFGRSIFALSIPTFTLPALHVTRYIYNGLSSGLSCSVVMLKLILLRKLLPFAAGI